MSLRTHNEFGKPESHSALPIPIEPICRVLYGVAAIVVLVVLVGGATRLTSSGLSITTWRPVSGIIPPFAEAQWQDLFAQYKLIPQYYIQNYDMTLDEFRTIYWWEWTHRFLARLSGLSYAVGVAILLYRRLVPTSIRWRLIGIFVLGGLQGYIGWYMVQSGLSERTEVSHYRLAVHFSLAMCLYSWLIWTVWDVRKTAGKLSCGPAIDQPATQQRWPGSTSVLLRAGGGAIRIVCSPYIILALIAAQLIVGSLVAGLKAGTVYNTWPLMEGSLIPSGLFQAPSSKESFLDDHLTVQWLHRSLAYCIVFAIAGAIWLRASSIKYNRPLQWLGVVVSIQSVLGIVTLLAVVPIALGMLHQAGAVALLTAALAWCHRDKSTKGSGAIL